jgi:tetratricopeptide (TPR) repeat protein
MMRRSGRRLTLLGLVLLSLVCLGLAILAYQLPPVQDRLGWRIAELRASIKYAISPPEEAVFTPDPTLVAMVDATMTALAPAATSTPRRGPSPTPLPSPTSTPLQTPVPSSALLTGVRHEYEKWNNCGPATLSMTLSYWGWEGDQSPIAAFVKPNPRDKNVMPYELEAFVESETDLEMVVRYGGTLELAKQFLAAGYPFMVEKGYDFPGADKGWMGHYQLLVGYDDAQGRFTSYDSYTGGPNLPVSYEQLEENWRAFNYTFLVPYPPDREEEVLRLLGEHADETRSLQIAAQRASDEIFASTGREQLFAWFNRGTSLYQLQDYAGAASAYDEAFRLDAAMAASDPDRRPWRLPWYQTGPYWAYFYTGRYYDVTNLATNTLTAMAEPVLEESYFWRGRAREALGDLQGAIEDYRTSAVVHPGFEPAISQLSRLGVPAP